MDVDVGAASPEPHTHAAAGDFVQEHHDDAALDNDNTLPGGYQLSSPTDIALARMYLKHPNLSRGMMDEIVQLTHLGPATARSGAELFKGIDSLPGELVYGCVR